METNAPSKSNERGALLGMVSFLSAVFAAGSVAMIGFTSFTAFNPPDWLRISTMAPLPLAIILSLACGRAGLKSVSGRVWAIAGLVLVSLSILAFGVMIVVGG